MKTQIYTGLDYLKIITDMIVKENPYTMRVVVNGRDFTLLQERTVCDGEITCYSSDALTNREVQEMLPNFPGAKEHPELIFAHVQVPIYQLGCRIHLMTRKTKDAIPKDGRWINIDPHDMNIIDNNGFYSYDYRGEDYYVEHLDGKEMLAERGFPCAKIGELDKVETDDVLTTDVARIWLGSPWKAIKDADWSIAIGKAHTWRELLCEAQKVLLNGFPRHSLIENTDYADCTLVKVDVLEKGEAVVYIR